MQMHIVRLRLESETSGAAQASLVCRTYQLVGRHYKEYCVVIKLTRDF